MGWCGVGRGLAVVHRYAEGRHNDMYEGPTRNKQPSEGKPRRQTSGACTKSARPVQRPKHSCNRADAMSFLSWSEPRTSVLSCTASFYNAV